MGAQPVGQSCQLGSPGVAVPSLPQYRGSVHWGRWLPLCQSLPTRGQIPKWLCDPGRGRHGATSVPVPGGSLPAEASRSPGSSSAWDCCQIPAPVLQEPGFPAALLLCQVPEHTRAFMGASRLVRIFWFSSIFVLPCPRNGSSPEVLCSSRCAGSWMRLQVPRLGAHSPPAPVTHCEHPALL